MIRSAYGIPGSAWEDACLPIFCLPCVANQLYQTVDSQPRIPYTEAKDMNRPWDAKMGKCSCSSCLYAFFCCQCAVASSASTGTGMPWCLAFFCMNMCAGRNMIRRHVSIYMNI